MFRCIYIFFFEKQVGQQRGEGYREKNLLKFSLKKNMYKFAVTQCVVAFSCSEDFILFKSWPPGVGRGHNGVERGSNLYIWNEFEN